MFKRELYLRQLRPFYRNEQIKILTGVRRSGKTELLKMIQAELAHDTRADHIIYLSFELLEHHRYRTPATLYEYLQSRIVDSEMHYIFLDEIQFVDSWPTVVNSLKAKCRNVSIFVTGSNSDLLSDDHESVLGGRTLVFHLLPFSFSEFHAYRTELNGGLEGDAEKEFAEYLRWGGFPLIFLEPNEASRETMLESIFDSIVLRDIIRRLKVKRTYHLEHVLDYVIASTGSYISGRHIHEKLLKDGAKLTLQKVLEYLKATEESCLVSIVPRFDIVGLNILEFNNKAYTCDPAFVYHKKSLVTDLYGSLYETIVYNDLLARGYRVRTGSAYGKEIDFVATKGNDKRIYIQVAYEITEKNRDREFGNLASIKDHYPKYVISRDHLALPANGIVHKNIVDFLLEER